MAFQLISAFEPTAVTFSALEKTRKGSKVVWVNLPVSESGRGKLSLQTPTVALPFGVSPYQEASTGEIQSYSVDLSFRGSDTDARMAEFLAKMTALDELVLDAAVKNSKEWFGKQMSKEIVSEFYRRLVKSNNPAYPPVMKVKVQLNDGQPNAAFFDEARRPVTIDYLVKNTSVKMIIEADRLWFINKNFGLTFRLIQLGVVNRPNRLEGFAFKDDGDDDMPAAGGAMDTSDAADADAVPVEEEF
jgi:hypothetical protein